MLIRSLDFLDPLDDLSEFYSVSAVEQDLAGGYWSITLPARGLDSPVYRWINSDRPGIELYDPDTDFRYGGPARWVTEHHKGSSTTITVAGVDFQALLGTRLEWPYPQNLSDWWKSQYPEPPQARTLPLTSAVYWIFDQNMGHSALPQRRMVEPFEYGSDPAAGGDKTFLSVGDPLIDSMRNWLTGTPFTARLRLKREQVGAGTPSTLLFECGVRQYTQFALTDATVDEWTVKDSAAASTWILAMGGTRPAGVDAERAALGLGPDDPDPPVRYITETADPLVNRSWLRPYNELFINRASLSYDFAISGGPLQDAAIDQLRREGPQRSLHVPNVTVDQYGDNLHVGWLVPAATLASQGVTDPWWKHLPVTKFRYYADPNGETRTIDIGEALGGPADGIFDSINQVAADVKALNLMSPRNV